MKPTHLQAGQWCPLRNKSCREFDCAWTMKLVGQNPNTDELVDSYGCAVSWLPILLVETATRSRSVAAAVESLRNTVVTPPAGSPLEVIAAAIETSPARQLRAAREGGA